MTQQTGAKAFAWKYDGAGRLVMKSLLNATSELEGYSYDVQDQLTQARVSGGATEYLEYDPGGLPLFRKVGSKGTWYIGTNATVTADVSSTCTGTASCLPIAGTERVGVHVQLGGTRVATIQAPRQNEAAAPYAEILYYHRDQQGSVVGTSRRSAGVDGHRGRAALLLHRRRPGQLQGPEREEADDNPAVGGGDVLPNLLRRPVPIRKLESACRVERVRCPRGQHHVRNRIQRSR